MPGIEISDVQIDRPTHSPFTRAGDAAVPAGVAERFNWVERLREPGPRVVVAAWTPPKSRGRALGLAALLVVVSGLIAWLFWRRGN